MACSLNSALQCSAVHNLGEPYCRQIYLRLIRPFKPCNYATCKVNVSSSQLTDYNDAARIYLFVQQSLWVRALQHMLISEFHTCLHLSLAGLRCTLSPCTYDMRTVNMALRTDAMEHPTTDISINMTSRNGLCMYV